MAIARCTAGRAATAFIQRPIAGLFSRCFANTGFALVVAPTIHG